MKFASVFVISLSFTRRDLSVLPNTFDSRVHCGSHTLLGPYYTGCENVKQWCYGDAKVAWASQPFVGMCRVCSLVAAGTAGELCIISASLLDNLGIISYDAGLE